MLMLISGLIGGAGLASLIWRRSLLGVLIGAQLLVLGATTMFVSSGLLAAEAGISDGHLSGLFIALSGLAQLATGFALAVRLFYLNGRADLSEVKSLRH